MTTHDVPDGLTALYQLQRFDARVGVRVLAARTVYGRKELRVSLGVPGPDLFARLRQRVSVALPTDEEYTWLVDINEDGRQDILMHHPSTTEPIFPFDLRPAPPPSFPSTSYGTGGAVRLITEAQDAATPQFRMVITDTVPTRPVRSPGQRR